MIDNKTLKASQNIMLDILIEVDKICQQHHIAYWLDSGTLLGAVRHKGFIPWDDDLDISMHIDDYYKFCTIAQKELSEGLFLQTEQTNPSFPYDFAKVRSDRGLIVEKHEQNKTITYNQGIFIDILPVIFVKEKKVYKGLYKSLFLVIKLFSYKYLNIKYFRKLCIHWLDSIHDSKNTITIRSGKFPEIVFYLDKSDIFPLKKIVFETSTFNVPCNSKKYLEVLYGKSYMELPPKHQRHTHAYSIKVKDL